MHVWRDPGFAAPRMPDAPSVLVHGQTVTDLLALGRPAAGRSSPGELGRAEAWGRHLAMEMALRSVGETPARRAGRRR